MFKNFFKLGKKDNKEKIDNHIENDLNKELDDYKEENLSEDISEEENLVEYNGIEENSGEENIEYDSQIELEEAGSEDDNNYEEADEKKIGFFNRLKNGLSKTRKGITEKVDIILKSYKKIDEELFEDLEEVLITADVGVNTTMDIIQELREKVKERKISEVSEIRGLLKEVLREVLTKGETNKLNIDPSPAIIMVVGVNGVGKTTTIGKLSSRLKSEGKKVLIAAGDTFRAAAIEQLQEWGNRAGVDIISHQEGADPAAVIYDGIQAAKARKIDVLICDTAGRLHNKKNLMNELSKIFRVVEREYPDARKEILLVVDATTGQNAVSQAKVFKEACDITGIVLTKLDGTAKGGVVLAVQSELDVPVKLVGVGEKISDLQDFDPISFVEAIFEE
ncbi:fused signal recognition particle receptor [Proteiniborus ethanoligenes]|uniref:Signal recognition particle receptor FtsY n=1 Tax=Proteiniborus ethanoligenes TaxID=415015 RepID=A0A1H3PMK6_9FIRM|nr:signal recognition particle-docking protein FtsY [Proteiniborus ethanoligenes]SDZ02248.1 fused signal recognition particle receptor [Proteiniborus ethanoligenes]